MTLGFDRLNWHHEGSGGIATGNKINFAKTGMESSSMMILICLWHKVNQPCLWKPTIM